MNNPNNTGRNKSECLIGGSKPKSGSGFYGSKDGSNTATQNHPKDKGHSKSTLDAKSRK